MRVLDWLQAATYLETILSLVTAPSAEELTAAGTALVEYIQKYPEQLSEVIVVAQDKAQYRREGLLAVAILLRAVVANDVNEQGKIWSVFSLLLL